MLCYVMSMSLRAQRPIWVIAIGTLLSTVVNCEQDNSNAEIVITFTVAVIIGMKKSTDKVFVIQGEASESEDDEKVVLSVVCYCI